MMHTTHRSPFVRRRASLSDERGVALVLSLILMLTMSVVAASMMFLAQTETYGTMNYRLMSQARYGAESGVQKSANYLLNTYVPPATAGSDLISAYNINASPVTYGGQPVILSANSAVASNYPVSAVQTAFNAAGQGTMTAGGTTIGYKSSAKMLSMVQAANGTAVTWEITSDGEITAGRTATVEVSAVLEKQLTVSISAVYGAFATGATCGAMTINSAQTDSYDSTAALGGTGKPVLANNNGNVGTNGNLNASNSAIIRGTLSTPRVGVGACSAGNVDALTTSGGATVTGGIVHLSQAVVEPTPATPNPAPPTTSFTVTDVSNCPGGVSGCTKNGDSSKTFVPGNYGNISLTDSAKMHFSAGTYNLNSLVIDNASQLILDSGPVTINIVGSTGSGSGACNGFACQAQPYWFNSSTVAYGGGFTALSRWDPTKLTVNYAGTGTVREDNAATSTMQINAPNATVLINSSEYYGTIIGKTVTFANAAKLHFDRHLGTAGGATFNAGADMLTAFTWKKN